MKIRLIITLSALLILLPSLQGCFPIVAAGFATGISAGTDRRTVGIQTEDESIEWKAVGRANENIDKRAHLNFTSFNRKVLITGEVPTAQIKQDVEALVKGIPNVELIFNELVIGPSTSLADRSNDSFVTTKIKSRSVDAGGKFNPLHVKVVTEAGVAFLMGILTEQEANAAIHVTRNTSGVKKVVNLVEIISPTQARDMDKTKQTNSTNSANSN